MGDSLPLLGAYDSNALAAAPGPSFLCRGQGAQDWTKPTFLWRPHVALGMPLKFQRAEPSSPQGPLPLGPSAELTSPWMHISVPQDPDTICISPGVDQEGSPCTGHPRTARSPATGSYQRRLQSRRGSTAAQLSPPRVLTPALAGRWICDGLDGRLPASRTARADRLGVWLWTWTCGDSGSEYTSSSRARGDEGLLAHESGRQGSLEPVGCPCSYPGGLGFRSLPRPLSHLCCQSGPRPAPCSPCRAPFSL